MYRLLVVDDEPYMADGLAAFFADLEHADLEVYTAYSASAALNWLSRTKFDVVLSDIRMPGMSGLELHKEIARRWPRCKVIFLSGYDDFTYAQEAMRNGSVDYLLKTEGDQALAEAVFKALDNIKQESEANALILKAGQQLRTALPFLQKEYFWGVLQGDPRSLQLMDKQFAELQIPLTSRRPVLLVSGRVDEWPESADLSDKTLMLYALQNISMEYLSASARVISIVYDHSRLVWFIQPTATESESDGTALPEDSRAEWKIITRFVQGTLESIQATCKQLLKLPLSFAVSSGPADWFALAAQFGHLQLLFGRKLGAGREIIMIDDSPVEDSGQRAHISFHMVEQLTHQLERGSGDEFKQGCAELMARVQTAAEDVNVNYYVKLEVYMTLSALFLAYLNRWNLIRDIGERFDLGKLARMESHASWNEAIRYVQLLADQIFAQRKNELAKEENRIVLQVKRYLEGNLSGDLSLTRLGEVVALNPFYLSRLYKQMTGESITDTISQLRLNNAKEMLRHNKNKMHEIAAALGFVSPPYFYRFFKKATGMTPQEYRNSVNR